MNHYSKMDKKVTADTPLIKAGAIVSSAVLTTKLLAQHLDRVKPYGTWRKGKAGHYSLPAYFDDGATGPSRPILVQISGYSKFGLGFFDEEKFGKKKAGRPKKRSDPDEDPEKEDSKRQPSASIAFDYDKNVTIQALDAAVNASSKDHMKKMLPQLLSQVAPGKTQKEVTCIQRKAARAPSGMVQRSLRVIAYPGKIELQGKSGVQSMDEYPKSVEGDYKMIIDWAGWDASFKDDVLSYGPVFYGRRLEQTEPVIRAPLEWTEDEDPKEFKAEDTSEDAVYAILQAKKKEEKEEKAAKQSKKRKRKTKETENEEDEEEVPEAVQKAYKEFLDSPAKKPSHAHVHQ